jgi:hypothetical protein
MAKATAPVDPIRNNNQTADDRASGRVTFDTDGRSVWEWQVSTGVFTRTVTEEQILELASTNLQLMDDVPVERDRKHWVYESERTSTANPVASKTAVNDNESNGKLRRLVKRLIRS